MAICKTEAIVLKAHNFSESSKVVTLYTKKYGKCAVVAKGVRRPKSSMCGTLEPATHAAIVFYMKEGREVHTLSQSDIITTFRMLQGDLERFSYASAVCELVDRLTPLEAENRALFALTLKTLGELERAQPDEFLVLLWFFELRMLAFLGFKPELDMCTHCKGIPDKTVVGFSLPKGGVLCSPCAVKDDEAYALSQKSLDFLRHLQRVRTENATKLIPPQGATSEIDNLLHAFLKYHTDEFRDIKSLRVLHMLRSQCSPSQEDFEKS
ncbi:MAG: DNA repair protein RecO [Gemmatimonadota bacterium]|nr:MAG: DNA repair protein RecO [Gemmatimonadota bacterium]